MFKLTYATAVPLLISSLFGLFIIAVPQPTHAQSLRGMSCGDLWDARNQIYAQKGYCFKTQRARAVFGARCYPPYGRLNRSEQARVDRIKRRERRRGCGVGGRTGAPPMAPPQGSTYANMSCSALWHERNAIFARNGHCFKTTRGRAAFGRRCYPPYGKLGRADQRDVNDILRWERRSGCR